MRDQPSRAGKPRKRTITDTMQEDFDPGLAGKFCQLGLFEEIPFAGEGIAAHLLDGVRRHILSV
jgi:hypothetical protein